MTRVRGTKTDQLSAVILAGGKSTRLLDKCFSTLENKELIVHVFEEIHDVTQEIVIVAKSPEQARRLQHLLPAARIVTDEMKEQSPLIGLLAGLRAITAPYVFAAACDTPFIKPDVIQFLFQRAIGNAGAVMIGDRRMLEPICAVYRRDSALRAAAQSIGNKQMSMLEMVRKLKKLARVPEEEVRKVDPQLLTFRNINTPEDLVSARDSTI